MPERPERPRRADYRHFLAIPTRWMDNDLYGHVNNVVYYSWIDTVVNRYLIDEGGLDISADEIIGVAAEGGCRFYDSVTYPETVDAGLRITRLGNSSVVYDVGIFRQGHADAVAVGHFVHVFVDRDSMRPASIPAGIRAALQRIVA